MFGAIFSRIFELEFERAWRQRGKLFVKERQLSSRHFICCAFFQKLT